LFLTAQSHLRAWRRSRLSHRFPDERSLESGSFGRLRWEHRFLAFAAAVIFAGWSGGCSGTGSTPPVPSPATVSILNAVRGAIGTYYLESELPPGDEPGYLSSTEHEALRTRIIADFEAYYTGSALSDRLTHTLQWADTVATVACVRTTVARIVAFDGQIASMGDGTAVVAGTYSVYQVNTAGSEPALSTWGGTLSMSYVASLDAVGGTWLLSSLDLQQREFAPDPSLPQGESPSPPGSSRPSSPSPFSS
jgi:hypothetical protein